MMGLKPVAIELSQPHLDGWTYGAESQVHTPSSCGVEGSIWQLAKTCVSVNDTGHHQLISHWKYALESSSNVYKNWKFTEQGLLKTSSRGVLLLKILRAQTNSVC